MNPVSRTARWIAAARAAETRRPDRLFEDRFAEALAGADGFALLAQMTQMGRIASTGDGPPENPYLAIRTRFIDDFLQAALPRSEARQLVILAAGLDARAYRLAFPAGTRVFELDRPEVLAFKDETLAQLGARPSCERIAIPLDLTQPFGPALRAAGFDPEQRSVWVVEGLLPYLDETEAAAVVSQCAELATRGSELVGDLPGRSFLTSPYVQGLVKALAAMDAPWRFGTDDPEGFFARFGWTATARRPGEPDASYGRWTFPMAPRDTPGVPQSFYVTARRG